MGEQLKETLIYVCTTEESKSICSAESVKEIDLSALKSNLTVGERSDPCKLSQKPLTELDVSSFHTSRSEENDREDLIENMTLDLEILWNLVEAIQSVVNSQEVSPSNVNNDMIKMQVEICDQTIKNAKLETDLCLISKEDEQ